MMPVLRLSRAPCLLPLVLACLAAGGTTGQEIRAEEPRGASHVLSLTLEDALRMAVENNLDLEIEELATQSRRFEALGSWGAFDPVLSLTAGLTDRTSVSTSQLSGAPSTSVNETTQTASGQLDLPFETGGLLSLRYNRVNLQTNNTFVPFDVSTNDVVTVSLTQPLLRGAWRRYATSTQRQAALAHDRQLENERLVRQQMLLDVSNAYWDLVSAREELSVRELAVSLGEEQLAQDRRRFEVGTGTEVDVLQSQSNLAQQKEDRLQARHDLRSAEDSLRRLLFATPGNDEKRLFEEWEWSIEPLTPLPEEVDENQVLDLDWRVSMERAIRSRPELWQSRLDIEDAEVGLYRARSERRSQLDLTLSATSGGFAPDPNDAFSQAIGFDFPTYAGTLTFSLPLRNRTAVQAVRSARAALRRARLAYDRKELDLLSEVRTAVREVLYRREAVVAARLSLDLAQRQLDAEEARFANGLSTTFQVLEFQRDLASALSTERSARAAFAKSVAALEHAEGRIDVHVGDLVR